mmetsp:Transcript_12682/g.19107  ORF Transcript_12682/g.19107 Transcript_12682/m.19107 type:complete len:596 (+) Transcript_12682:96-1883(+)
MSGVDSIEVKDLSSLPNIMAVEMPCLVQSPEATAEMLGGYEAISRAVDSQLPHMVASLPSSVHPHQIRGRVVGANGILLRVRRKKKSGAGNVPESFGATVIGRVQSCCKFDTPCDYKFVAMSQLPSYNPQRSVIEIMPSRFLRHKNTSGPLHLFLSHGEQVAKERSKKEDGVFFKYGETLPGEAAFPPLAREDSTLHVGSRERVRTFLTTAFSLRECWSRHDLMSLCGAWVLQVENLAGVPVTDRETVLTDLSTELRVIAFKFSSGPWKNLWVRRGFNPLASPSACLQQVIEARIPHRELKAMISRLAAVCPVDRVVDLDTMQFLPADDIWYRIYNQLRITHPQAQVQVICFGRPLTTQPKMQLCAVQDERILQFVQQIHSARPNSLSQTSNNSRVDEVAGAYKECTKSCGWLTSDEIEGARKTLQKVVAMRVDEFLARHSTSDSAAQKEDNSAGYASGDTEDCFEYLRRSHPLAWRERYDPYLHGWDVCAASSSTPLRNRNGDSNSVWKEDARKSNDHSDEDDDSTPILSTKRPRRDDTRSPDLNIDREEMHPESSSDSSVSEEENNDHAVQPFEIFEDSGELTDSSSDESFVV